MFFPVPTRIQHGGENEAAPWANTLLIAVNVIVFWLGWSASWAVGPGTSVFSVLTYGFAHAGISHLLANMWLLWIFGNAVNRRVGNGYYLLSYLGSIVVLGTLVRFLCDGYVMGSSGGVLAVMAIAIMLLPSALVSVAYVALFPITLFIALIQKPKQPIDWFLRWGNAQLHTFWFLLIVPAIEIWGLWRWSVATGTWNWTNLIHLLGFLCGITAVLMLPTRLTMRRESSSQLRTSPLALVGTIGLVVLLLGAVFFSSSSARVIKLGKNATAEEIGEAYEAHVKYIKVGIKIEYDLGNETTLTAERKSMAIGTGILIANDMKNGLIVTNRHVIDPFYPHAAPEYTGREKSKVTLKIRSQNARERADDDRDDRFVEARLAAYHSTQDLALLIVEREYKRPTAIRVATRESLSRGEGAIAIGNSLGKPYIVTSGNLSGFDDGTVLTSCPISPGNSGGPLFLKRYGMLAGINSASYIDGQNLNLAIPAENILESLATPAALKMKARAEARIEKGVAKRNEALARRNSENGPSITEEESGWVWSQDGRDKDLVLKLARMVPLSD